MRTSEPCASVRRLLVLKIAYTHPLARVSHFKEGPPLLVFVSKVRQKQNCILFSLIRLFKSINIFTQSYTYRIYYFRFSWETGKCTFCFGNQIFNFNRQAKRKSKFSLLNKFKIFERVSLQSVSKSLRKTSFITKKL